MTPVALGPNHNNESLQTVKGLSMDTVSVVAVCTDKIWLFRCKTRRMASSGRKLMSAMNTRVRTGRNGPRHSRCVCARGANVPSAQTNATKMRARHCSHDKQHQMWMCCDAPCKHQSLDLFSASRWRTKPFMPTRHKSSWTSKMRRGAALMTVADPPLSEASSFNQRTPL